MIIRGRRRSGRNAGAGYERRDWLPVNELGGATRHPAHLTEEQVAQRVRQQVEASLDPAAPSCSSRTRPTSSTPRGTGWSADGGGDAPAPAHEGPEERELPAVERLRGQAALRAPAAGRAAAAERGGGVRRLRRHAAPRLEAPRHLRRGGARVLRVAQRPHARAELAGRPGGQLRPGAEGAPHRVLLGLRRALLHVQGREEGAGAAGARALPGARRGRPCRPSKSGGASTPRTCSRGCSGARTCGRCGASSWPPARAPRWP